MKPFANFSFRYVVDEAQEVALALRRGLHS
jgi:hypothetical protein